MGKARIKKTGEIVEFDDTNISLLDYARGLYRCKTTGEKYHWKDLEFIEEEAQRDIDWNSAGMR